MNDRTKVALASMLLGMALIGTSTPLPAAEAAGKKCNDDDGTAGEYHFWGATGACYDGIASDATPHHLGTRCGTHTWGENRHVAC